MTARRFAEDTSVPVGRTQDEAKERLRKAGADQLAVYESDERSSLAFRLSGRLYRLTVPHQPNAKDRRQDDRRAWRLLLLLLKAKLEAVREGASTIEREFLADMLLGDGSTVSEKIGPELQLAYETGQTPQTLLLTGPTT